MAEAETAAFEARPCAMDACQVRRRDDEARDPDAPAPSFADFGPLLSGLAR